MQSTKQAVFMLGEAGYSLDIIDVIGIEKVTTLNTVSSLPKNFKGVIILRGDKIPVYSLRRKFHLDDIDTDDETRHIISMVDGIKIAFEVDKMTEIVQVEEDQLNDVPTIVKEEDTSYMKSIIKVNDRLVIVLNPNGVLSADELNKVKAVINNDENVNEK
jgi:purine-binding chemotaxis protein CheW